MVFLVVAHKQGQVLYHTGRPGFSKLSHYRESAKRYNSQEAASKAAQCENRWEASNGLRFMPAPLAN